MQHLINSHKITSETRTVEWRIFLILSSEDADDVISAFSTVVCENDHFVDMIKRKLDGDLKIWIVS